MHPADRAPWRPRPTHPRASAAYTVPPRAVGALDSRRPQGNVYMFDVQLQDLSSKPEWYQDSIRVLGGDFTNPNDRRKLVPIILGLWASCLRNRHDGAHTRHSRTMLFPLCCANVLPF
eukprot:3911946-Prymnesium_polylepis.1